MIQHRLRVAVLGSGAAAGRWASAFEPYAAVSFEPEEASGADALVIAPGARDPFATVKKALADGVPTLYAEAFRLNPWEAALLDALRSKTGAVLRFAEPFHHEGGFRFLQRLTRGTEPLWQIRYLRTTSLAACAPVEDLAMADLSLCQALLDLAPLSVTAAAAQRGELGEVCAIFLTVSYPHDIVVQCTISQAEPSPTRQLMAVTRTRTVSIDRLDAGSRIEVTASSPARTRVPLRRAMAMPSSDPIAEEARRFVQAVTEGDVPISNSERWVRVAALWWAARQSMSFRGAVEVPVPQVMLTPANAEPPPLRVIEGGGRATRASRRPHLTLIAG